MSKEAKPYEYFDTPDGEDLDKKLLCLVKPTALVTFATATVDVVLWSKPKGYLPTLARYGHYAWPIFGATSLFVITHNTAATLRGKDDRVNWFLAGASAGAVLGLWRKRLSVGIIGGLAMGATAALRKWALDNNYPISPWDSQPAFGGVHSVRHDWTLTADRPRNWSTGE